MAVLFIRQVKRPTAKTGKITARRYNTRYLLGLIVIVTIKTNHAFIGGCLPFVVGLLPMRATSTTMAMRTLTGALILTFRRRCDLVLKYKRVKVPILGKSEL